MSLMAAFNHDISTSKPLTHLTKFGRYHFSITTLKRTKVDVNTNLQRTPQLFTNLDGARPERPSPPEAKRGDQTVIHDSTQTEKAAESGA